MIPILLILFALFLAGAHGLRLRFRSALAESTAIREQMDRHSAAVTDALWENDNDMATFELALLDGVWNRIAERCDRFRARHRLARWTMGPAPRMP